MILPLNLNRRHKVTLFLTVVLAGIAALSGAKMMQVVGIVGCVTILATHQPDNRQKLTMG